VLRLVSGLRASFHIEVFMSEEIINNWQPRKPIILNCPSGSRCEVQKPGPELGLKTAHLQRRLRALLKASGAEVRADMTEAEKEEAGLDALEKMSDAEKEVSLQIARITVACCVRKPKLYLEPKQGQLGVDDIDESDFWFIYKWHQDGCLDPANESEVTAEEADTFSSKQTSSVGTGNSVSDVRAEAEPMDEAA